MDEQHKGLIKEENKEFQNDKNNTDKRQEIEEIESSHMQVL